MPCKKVTYISLRIITNDNKTRNTMTTINIHIRKEDVVNINLCKDKQSTLENTEKESIGGLATKLYNDLKEFNKRNDKEKGWWYEVFIDFKEDFEEFIYPTIKDMRYEEQFTFCLGYMYKMDIYHLNSECYDFLNELI